MKDDLQQVERLQKLRLQNLYGKKTSNYRILSSADKWLEKKPLFNCTYL